MAAALFRRWSSRRRPAGDPAPGDAVPQQWPVDRGSPVPPPVHSSPGAHSSSPVGSEALADGIRDYVRIRVRSGLYDVAELRRLAIEAAETEITEPAGADELARAVLSDELTQWRADAQFWFGRTDPERLDRALATLSEHGLLVLPALDDADVLNEVIRIRGCPRGAVAYLVSDVWHAVDSGELALRVVDSAGRSAGPGSPIVAEVMDALAAEGLLGMVSRNPVGALAVALSWRRRPPTVNDQTVSPSL